MCGLAKINPLWLSDNIHYSGNEDDLSQATFTVFDTSGKHHDEVVSYGDATGSLTSNDAASAAW
jgi:hypothetical protein